METTENPGGEGGGKEKLVLTRSELALLRRKSEFPFTPEERQEIVTTVMDISRTSRSRRHKLAAAKTVAILDSVNVRREAIEAHAGHEPIHTSQVNVNVGVKVVEVIENENWYGNDAWARVKASAPSAESVTAPGACAPISEPVQGDRSGPAVGEVGNGTLNGHPRPR